MTIAVDADDMDALRARLGRAADEVRDAVPAAPGGAAFGPAVLAGAVAAFDASVRRDAEEVRTRWRKLDDGVRGVFDDLSDVEDGASAEVARLGERLA